VINRHARASNVENHSAESRMLGNDDLGAGPDPKFLHAQEIAPRKIDMRQPQRCVLRALAKIHCNLTSL
jgi:hypothetical protein